MKNNIQKSNQFFQKRTKNIKGLVFALMFFSLGIFTYLAFERMFPKNLISAYVDTFEINTDEVLNKVNNFRQENGLKTLIKNDKLCSVARTRLTEVGSNWSHKGFSAARFCVVNCHIGENLARDFKSEQTIVDGWKNSPTHRDVMLMSDMKYGCVASNGQYTVLEVSSVIP